MTIDHFIVFIGAGAPLSDELRLLEKRISRSKVIAPAVKLRHVGISEPAICLASSRLYDELKTEAHASQEARLYIWMYAPTDAQHLDLVLAAFGHASWIETIPSCQLHKPVRSRQFIESRMTAIRQLLHEVSGSTYAQRKSSPLTLPLRNFKSDVTRELKSYWYTGLDKGQITKRIRSLKSRHFQNRNKATRAYVDDKDLAFRPANDTECHGQAHPTGSDRRSYFCGRFRFGVSLFPGFHFDVSPERGSTIQCDLRTASGERRSMRSENRKYINIFPNDHLLPEK